MMLKLYDRRNQVIEVKAIAQIPPPRKAIANLGCVNQMLDMQAIADKLYDAIAHRYTLRARLETVIALHQQPQPPLASW